MNSNAPRCSILCTHHLHAMKYDCIDYKYNTTINKCTHIADIKSDVVSNHILSIRYRNIQEGSTEHYLSSATIFTYKHCKSPVLSMLRMRPLLQPHAKGYWGRPYR